MRQMLAKLHRAGELTAIWIPDAAHEVMQGRCGHGRPAVRVLVKAPTTPARLPAALRADLPGARAWTLAYRRWLSTVQFEHPAQQIVLQDYIHAVQEVRDPT